MDLTIYPRKLSGAIQAIPSKSQAHRLLICSAFADTETIMECPQTNQDIEATVRCLNALGADIVRTAQGYHIKPITEFPDSATMDCGESGSTLRFLLPIVCALGINTTIQMHGRLPYRPLSPLWEELERMGCQLTRPTETTIQTAGKLHSGNYLIDGNISSQFISGLLFATALMDGKSTITILGVPESKPYIEMTQLALNSFGVDTTNYHICGAFPFSSPGRIVVEGDWSNAAFFIVAKALDNLIKIDNLSLSSPQGDRAIAELLKQYDSLTTIDVTNIPDLVPILAVFFGSRRDITFTGISRLRLKESDRVASVCNMISQLGASAYATDNTISVISAPFHSCTIDSVGDHRIAMAAAIGATVADGPITILGAECVSKSYPGFWDEYKKLGGYYEQHIR